LCGAGILAPGSEDKKHNESLPKAEQKCRPHTRVVKKQKARRSGPEPMISITTEACSAVDCSYSVDWLCPVPGDCFPESDFLETSSNLGSSCLGLLFPELLCLALGTLGLVWAPLFLESGPQCQASGPPFLELD
jgi:hypothetical protein